MNSPIFRKSKWKIVKETYCYKRHNYPIDIYLVPRTIGTRIQHHKTQKCGFIFVLHSLNTPHLKLIFITLFVYFGNWKMKYKTSISMEWLLISKCLMFILVLFLSRYCLHNEIFMFSSDLNHAMVPYGTHIRFTAVTTGFTL